MPCRIIETPSSDFREKKLQREAEERKLRMAEAQRREVELINSRRLTSLEQQAEWFKAGIQQAQQQQAAMNTWQQMIDALHAYNHPPQPIEPEIVVIEQHPADDLMFNGFIKRL